MTRSKKKYMRALLPGLLLAAAALTLAPGPASASDFTVTNTNDNGAGSLRRVIDLANLNPGVDVIKFAIPGEGVQSIRPTSGLPVITEAVTIDGYSQPGSSRNTLVRGTNARILIELDGTEERSSFANGLHIGADNVVVQGLAINGFGNNGISVGPEATDNRIEGNFIGTNPSGTRDLGNRLDGVAVFGSGNTVGGTSPFQRNLISGNTHGVHISTFQVPGDNRVEGNLIGTQKDGTTDLGNSASGVRIQSSANSVGGPAVNAANTIAFNGDDGVTVIADGSTGNRILGNAIFSNAGIGIDLNSGDSTDGPNPNDPDDADSGPNDLQNRPVLTSATISGDKKTIKGKLDSTPSDVFLIQFFSNPAGQSEGKRFIGADSVTTDANGDATFASPVERLSAGQTITATATEVVGGNTSEFSLKRKVIKR